MSVLTPRAECPPRLFWLHKKTTLNNPQQAVMIVNVAHTKNVLAGKAPTQLQTPQSRVAKIASDLLLESPTSKWKNWDQPSSQFISQSASLLQHSKYLHIYNDRLGNIPIIHTSEAKLNKIDRLIWFFNCLKYYISNNLETKIQVSSSHFESLVWSEILTAA